MPDPPPPPPSWSSDPQTPEGASSFSVQPVERVERKVTLGSGQTAVLASVWNRGGARILDWTLMAVVGLVLLIPTLLVGWAVGAVKDVSIFSLQTIEETPGIRVSVVFILLTLMIGVAYEPVMIALRGQTLGKMATRIRVVRADNGLPPGWSKSIARWIMPSVLIAVPLIAWVRLDFGILMSVPVYLSFSWDRLHQGWHDKMAGTLVIKV